MFRLGMGRERRRGRAAGAALPRRRRRARRRWTRVRAHWQRTLGAVQVRNARPGARRAGQRLAALPDLACRMWARSGYYQSGGAFGFRDQLQDAMALVHAEPRAAARAPAAVRRPPVPRGRRAALVASAARAAACARTAPTTTCGCRWRRAAMSRRPATPACSTRRVPFLEGRPVNAGRRVVLRPAARARTRRRALYEHCVRAIVHGLRFGAHGLPLMGCGDWNDGMNLVGDARPGRERLAGLLPLRGARRASPTSRARAATRRSPSAARRSARSCARNIEAARLGRRVVPARLFRRRHAARLARQRRMPDRLDRAELVGAVRRRRPAARARRRWTRVDAHLVRRDARLVQLLDPPFDKSALEPRLHHGLRARRARERRPVHPRRDLGGDGVRRSSATAQRAWELLRMINPVNHAHDAERRRRLQGRALRGGGRRLRRRAAHRPRRLDLVHRLGRLDVPADRRVAARPAPRSRASCASRRACRPSGTGSSCTTATARRGTASRCSRVIRDAHQKHVALAEHGGQHLFDHFLLADDDLAQFLRHSVEA